MTQTTNNTLLNLEETTQPFDLATALRYMKEHGEFIRCKSATQDFICIATCRNVLQL